MRGVLTGPRRERHADVGVDERLAPRRDGGGACGEQVVARCKSTAPGWEPGLVRELLDEQRRGARLSGCHGFADCGGGAVRLDALCRG